MLVLGIETHLRRDRGRGGRARPRRAGQDPVQYRAVADQRACRLRRRGAGDRRARPCRGARPHHRQGDGGGRQDVRRDRRRRGRGRPRPDRRRDRRAHHRQGDRAGQRQAADRGQPPRSACADRAADRRRRRFPIACSSPPAATPRSSRCAASATTSGSAPRSTTPSARPSTRPRSCWASAIPAGRRSRRRRRAATPTRFALPRPMQRPRRAGFLAVGPEDRAAARGREDRAAQRPGRRRSLRLVPAGGGRCGPRPAARRPEACSAHATARRPRWSPPAASPPTRRSARCCSGVAFEAGIKLVVPPAELCTDNGAMIAWAGAERLALGPHRSARLRAARALAARRGRRPEAAAAAMLTQQALISMTLRSHRGARRRRLGHRARQCHARAPAARSRCGSTTRPTPRQLAQTAREPRSCPACGSTDGIAVTRDLAEAARADAILLVVPAQAMRAVVKALAPLIAPARRSSPAPRASSTAPANS